MPDTHTVVTAADFPTFYRAVHGFDPFPWQQGLVEEVLARGAWPDLIDVPTGLGKTSMMDIAVFVAAATAHQPGPDRLGRRRCFFVVDRRIVVDEAYQHAQQLARALATHRHQHRSGNDDVLNRVAAALGSFAPTAGGDLLPVTRMRGGTTWASAWLDRPDRPGLVLGTVDQVGSRLLFRGYGVTDRRRPIDAALVGTDALLLVDEAHLSTALLSTVTAAQEHDRLGVPLPGLSVVRLSATGAPSRQTFALDVDAHRNHPTAWQRLTAGKQLTTVQATPATCVKVLADTVVEQLTVLAGDTSSRGDAPTALVVCNTVDRARAVHAHLMRALSARDTPLQADCDLLIGRSRPIDRPHLQQRILDRYGTGRTQPAMPAVLVATQTVEVGVNLDADVLVSESASRDALVQRLGRLNRLGEFTTRFPGRDAAPAVVVHDGVDDGPVYGAARDATWRALTELTSGSQDGTVDVSPLACRRLTASTFARSEMARQPVEVPVLLGPTLDAWVQTGPVPLNDPPIEPFLHGFDGGVAGVQVVWRDGLLSDDPLDDPFDDDAAELAASSIDGLLATWPPRTAELVEVPFIAVRQWMNGQATDPVSDLESAPDVEGRVRQVRDPFRALVRRGGTPRRRPGDPAPDTPTTWRWIDARQVRPGDVIVVPSERGGLDAFGWAPTEQARVRDASEIATFLPGRGRREGMLRLDRDLPLRLGLDGDARASVAELVAGLLQDDEEPPAADRLVAFTRHLAVALPEQPDPAGGWPPDAWALLRAWAARGRLRIVDLLDTATDRTIGDGDPARWGRVLAGPIPAPGEAGEGDERARSEEDTAGLEGGVDPLRDDEEVAASSIGTSAVTLAMHHAAVRRRAGDIAAALGLPDEVVDVVRDAAGWHDLGKVEERFQVMLHGGDAIEAALALEPLAKSGLDPSDPLAWRRSRQLSRLPAGARHEAWSAALVEEHVRQRGVPYSGDVDLLIHLVASHHGYARPWARLVIDTQPRPVEAVVDGEKVTVASDRTVCLDHPARFARLNQRYGRWGLALLEAVVRCADMTVSQEGS